MPKSYITVDETSDEVTFVKSLIHAFINNPAIVNAGHTVTCSKTDSEIDAMYAGNERPVFDLIFDGSASLRFERQNAENAYYFDTTCVVGQHTWLRKGVYFLPYGSGKAKTETAQRKCLVQIYSNSNVIDINIGHYDKTFPVKPDGDADTYFMVYTEKENGVVTYCVAGNTSNIYGGNSRLGELSKLLNYIKSRENITEVDIIENKILCQYTSGATPIYSILKKFNNLWDSSYYGGNNFEGLFRPVNVSGKTGVYIDYYTFMPI